MKPITARQCINCMDNNVLKDEDITENIIVFKPTKSYKENMTKMELYDITRGYWRVKLERAQYVDYAFCVYKDIVKEVYKIEEWLPAEKLPRTTLPDAEVPKGTYGFKGEIAEKEIRDKYIGKSVKNLCRPGQYNFKYLPSSQNRVHNKKICNSEVIEEVQKIEEEIVLLNIDNELKKAIVNVRVNQGKFRDILLKRYNNKCCLCDVKKPELLIASHIKPWAKSEPEEKADVNNGFLMCPNHDRLFDKGYITFNDDGKIKISGQLKKTTRFFLM